MDFFLADAVVRLHDSNWTDFAEDLRALTTLARLGCNRFAFYDAIAPYNVRLIEALLLIAEASGALDDPGAEPVRTFLRSLDPIDPLQAGRRIREDLRVRDRLLEELAASPDPERIAVHHWIAPLTAETDAKPEPRTVRRVRTELRQATEAILDAFDRFHRGAETAVPWTTRAAERIQQTSIGSVLKRDLAHVVAILEASERLADIRRKWIDEGAATDSRAPHIADLVRATSLWVPGAVATGRGKEPQGGVREAPALFLSADAMDAIERAADRPRWPLEELLIRSTPLGAPETLRIPGFAAGLSEIGRAMIADAALAAARGDHEQAQRRANACFMMVRRLADQHHSAYALAAAKILAAAGAVRADAPEQLRTLIDHNLDALPEADPVGLLVLLRSDGEGDPVAAIERRLRAAFPADEAPNENPAGRARLFQIVADSAEFGWWECGLEWSNIAWVLPEAELHGLLTAIENARAAPTEEVESIIRNYARTAAARIVHDAGDRDALAKRHAIAPE